MQQELFKIALDELDGLPDLINQVLEVSLTESEGDAVVSRYRLPAWREFAPSCACLRLGYRPLHILLRREEW